MKISIIAAIGKNRELGKDNKLIWHIKEDLQRFKSFTKGHPIIMGRKTWESLPFKPLPNRTNIVVTRDKQQITSGAVVCSSIEEALAKAREIEKSETFIIGGGQIYQQALPFADKLYLTIVNGDFDADTFFPDYSEFKKVVFEQAGESEGLKYKFVELQK